MTPIWEKQPNTPLSHFKWESLVRLAFREWCVGGWCLQPLERGVGRIIIGSIEATVSWRAA